MKHLQRPAMLNQRDRAAGAGSIAVSVLLAIIVLLLILELLFVAHYTPVRVDGTSMCNTLQDGDWVYEEEGEAARGDIVTVYVAEYKTSHGTPLFQRDGIPIEVIIKRLIGIEGDSVKCEGGVIFVKYAGETDFHPLEEPYAFGTVDRDFPAVEVGKGEIFVLGDNRRDSYDSSEVGCLKREDILGVVANWSIEHKTAVARWETFREKLRTAFGGTCG